MRPSTEPDDRGLWGGARRPRLPDVLCALGLALSGVYSLAFTPAVPSLLASHTVLLELLTGSTPAVVTAGAYARVGHLDLPTAVLAALPGVMMFDPFFWWAGRRWGRGAATYVTAHSPRMTRSLHRTERWVRRFGWLAVALGYYLPVPNGLVYAAAGWTGMRLRTFLALDVIGALLWIAGLVGLGYALGHSGVHVAKAISHYGLMAGIALFVLVVAWQAWRARALASVPARSADPPGND